MRKIISLTLATAMVASMAVSAFAAETVRDTSKVDNDAVNAPVITSSDVKVTPTNENLTVTIGGVTYAATEASTVKEAVLEVYSKLPTSIEVDAFVTGSVASIFDGADGNYLVFRDKAAADVVTTNAHKDVLKTEAGKADWQVDPEAVVSSVAYADPDDWNANDGVKPGKSIYFLLKGDFNEYFDNFKFTVSKGENAKKIKSVSVVQKRFGGAGLSTSGSGAAKYQNTRLAAVKVDLADDMTDKEFKVSFDLKVKVDESFTSKTTGISYEKGQSSKKWEEIGATWMFNSSETTDDREFLAGDDGIMVKPVKNEENTVLWTDQNRDLARLTFVADSDVAKYFPKLSTKWPNATYAQLFDDQDAFVFDFVGNPKISSTSRAVLELFCPFIDDEDEYTVDPESVVIYQVADDATLAASTEVELAKAILDGRLIDVTDKFTAGENEDGDFVYTTKTRTLGTYIIAEKAPSEEAFEEAEGEAPVEEPTENTEKPNPGTGR